MPRLRAILAAFSLTIFAVLAAHAQGTVVTSVQVGQGRGAGSGSGSGSGVVGSTGGVIGSILGPGISGTPGQPFSADVIDETDRLLADGNHIHRENHGRIFRDSQGRTRTETEIGTPAPGTKPFVHIMIADPVESRFILLNPEQKTATIHQSGKGISAAPGLGAPAQPANNNAKSDAPSAPAVPGALVQSLRNMPAVSGAQAGGKLQISREDLGATEIEGFTVTGTRYTHTIPAGERGNDQPMTTTSERWF